MKRNLKILSAEAPDPIHVISLGGGTQSSAMLLMADAGLLTPKPDYAIFADTLGETQTVYDWLDWLRANVKSIPIVTVSEGDLMKAARTIYTSKGGREYTRRLIPYFTKSENGKIGRAQTRGCTHDFKIVPIRRYMRKQANLRYGENRLRVIQWLGITVDEAARMRDSNAPWLGHRYPLIEIGMTRQDCIDWVQANFQRIPPRSSCFFCPFHSADYWRDLKLFERKSFNDAITFERQLQASTERLASHSAIPYLTRRCKPLDQAVDEMIDERSKFQEECSGHCGV